MKALIIAIVLFTVVFVALIWNFPWPLEGWYDYVYACFIGIIGLAIYGLGGLFRKLRNND